MDSTALLSVVGGLFVLSIVFLTGLCLHCKENGQRKYTEQYPPFSQQETGFTVIRTHEREHPFTTTLPSHHQPQLLTSPLLPDLRRLSACPSSNGSDYVNQNEDDDFDDDGPGYEIPPDKNQDDPEYLDVLPDDTHQSQQSLASSANSAGQNYENVPESHVHDNTQLHICIVGDDDDDDDEEDDDDDQEYINVNQPCMDFQTPIGSYGSSDGHDSSDYVNAPNQVIT